MAMTKKDFERLARALRKYGPTTPEANAPLFDFLREQNPRFDAERFQAMVEGKEPKAKDLRAKIDAWLKDFKEFSANCEAEEYTDTDAVWPFLNDAAALLKEVR